MPDGSTSSAGAIIAEASLDESPTKALQSEFHLLHMIAALHPAGVQEILDMASIG